MNPFIADFLLALAAQTRIRAAGAGTDAQRALAHAPGAGWLVGVAACVAFAIVSVALPGGMAQGLAAAVGCTMATVLLTGAMNEDALARFASRGTSVASAGVLALLLAVSGKLALLAVLAGHSPAAVMAALFAAHAVSRFWPLLLMRWQGEPLGQRDLVIAGAWCVPPLLLMLPAGGVPSLVLAVGASALAYWVLRRVVERRGSDVRGEATGAAQQACEIAFYLGTGFGLGGH